MLKTLTVVNCTVVDSSCICRNAAAMTADMMPCLLRNCTMEIALSASFPMSFLIIVPGLTLLFLEMARVQAKMCDQPAESRQRQLMAATVVCFTLQAFFIALKFYTRKVIQGRLMMDDWILVAAVVSPLIGSAVLFWCSSLVLADQRFLSLIMWQPSTWDWGRTCSRSNPPRQSRRFSSAVRRSMSLVPPAPHC